MNPYTSLWTGVTAGDGPQEFHVVLLDAGRTDVLADEVGRQALACIRCSACLNVCPVYARTGGQRTSPSTPGPSARSSRPSCGGSGRPTRFLTRRASAVPATRCARSRSTSRKCSSIFAAGSSPRRLLRGPSVRPCACWPGRSAPIVAWEGLNGSDACSVGPSCAAVASGTSRASGLDRHPRPPSGRFADLPRVVDLAVSAARDEILARIRRALDDVPGQERPEDVLVPRDYRESEPGEQPIDSSSGSRTTVPARESWRGTT